MHHSRYYSYSRHITVSIYSLVGVFFFFQAEDGIRDADVTGVQTCALPIYDLARPSLGGQGERDDLQRSRPGRGEFDLERLLFRRHDPFERGIARLVQALVGGEHGRQRELHDLDAAFDLALRRPRAAGDLEVSDGRDAGQVEQLRHHGTDLMVVIVDRHLPEQDQVEAGVLELRRQ